MNKLKLSDVSVVITKGTTPTTVGGQFLDKGINFVKSDSVGQFKHLDNRLFQFIDEKTDEKLKRSRLKVDDLLFSIAGAYLGKLSVVRKKDLPANTNQAVGIVRLDKSQVDVNYLYYYFSQKRINEYINNLSSQSSQPNLNLALLGNLEFDYSTIKIQKQISKVLSDLDAKIEINNKINQELEAMAKLLYDYWFVQFDFPYSPPSEGCPQYGVGIGKPYKSSGGKMVYNEELNRKIPKGWKVKTFSEWIKNDKSGDWGKEKIEGNYMQKVYCIRGADINGLNGAGNLKSPERYILEKNLHKILDPADLIVEISGGSPTQSTGRLAYITEGTLERFDAPIICSNFCKAVTLKNKKLLYNFVYHWKSIYDAGVLFGYEGKTSGIKNLLFDSFVSSHYTVVPNDIIAEKFFDFMEPIQAKKQKNLLENQKLTELRDWLLPMLMNGQVTVGDVAAQLGMVAEPQEKYKN